MTRTITGKQLLEKGPMTTSQFAAALGVSLKSAYSTLQNLLDAKIAERGNRRGQRGYVYRLAA